MAGTMFLIRNTELSTVLALAILVLTWVSLDHFCSVLFDLQTNSPVPAGPLAWQSSASWRTGVQPTHFSPATEMCWRGAEPLEILIIVAMAGLLTALAGDVTGMAEKSAAMAKIAAGLRVFGRLVALLAFALLLLVVYGYAHIEYLI